MTTGQIVLWVYIALLMAGGFMGFMKAGSKASLIASSIFSAILALFALGILYPFVYHLILLGVLLIFFGKRYMKSKKFMPSGLMVFLTIVALVLGFVLR